VKTSANLRAALALLPLTLALACGGGGAKTPQRDAKLPAALASAFREEATGDPKKAVDLHVEALLAAGASPDDPASVGVAVAALDALVHGSISAFAETAKTSALADRLGQGVVDARLADAERRVEGPFVPHLVANARLALAERRGDAKAAETLRAQSGCAREAVVAGPLSYATVSDVRAPNTLDRAPIPARVEGPGPFLRTVEPAKVDALGCHLPLYAQSSAPGIREVVVDVEVPESGIIGVGLRSAGAATLRAGGQMAIDRPYALGSSEVLRFARVDATKGTLRLVARVGMEQDFATVEIGAWDGDGKPLRARAPAVGQAATAPAKRAYPVTFPPARTNDERLAAALHALGAHEPRSAENLLHDAAKNPDTPPELLLAYGRAVRLARDLPNVKAHERARAAYERVLEAWPTSWEAVLEHAVLAGARRGRAEADIEALVDLAATRKKAKVSPALLDAFEAQIAGREGLRDRARAAFERAKGPLAGTALLRHVERVAFERTGAEAIQFECDPRGQQDRTSLGCHHARLSSGDRAGAERELERLRALAGSPRLYLSLSARNAIESGDLGRAAKILEATHPGDRTLSNVYAVKGKAAVGELLQLAVTARDAPRAIAGLLRDAGNDPLTAWAGVAEKVTSEDAGGPSLAGAATAVLAHEERYEVDENGLVHFVLFDVRRVMGTTDVETNAQAQAPMLFGRDAMRILRRRIFKKDGRILLPDRTPYAAQSHADLSQLEAGDAIEAVYEGWGVPAEMGSVGIDTPDLLPERTTVRDATITIRLPKDLKTTFWSHAILGSPKEKVEGASRVLSWNVKNRPVRRLESGVPKMDRNVMVSVSSATWDDVAKGQRDAIAALDADSPEVTAWAREAAQGARPSKELVEKIVAASGQAVKEASGFMLADFDLGRGGGTPVTARTILATHEGSRTWLIVRALRELGVATDVVVAENEPFSNSPSFPPHFGRFMHPLAVARVPASGKNGGMTEVWIDADVNGPPLPAGRISPELRGRAALYPDGRIAPLPNVASGEERDEIDIRLAVDPQGDAKGQLTVLLRGRAAQDLSEALFRLVGLERQRALRGIALAWVPFATVEKVELSSSEGSWQVAIRAELTAPAYAQVEGSKPGSRTWVLPGIDPIHYVFPRPYVTTLGATYAAHGARENALAINRATQYHLRRRVELPPSAQVSRVPGPFDGKGPLLDASRRLTVNGQTIEEDFTLEVTTGTVPTDGYDEFVAAARSTDDAFRASTRVRPPTP
jgi:hypothetical protein